MLNIKKKINDSSFLHVSFISTTENKYAFNETLHLFDCYKLETYYREISGVNVIFSLIYIHLYFKSIDLVIFLFM